MKEQRDTWTSLSILCLCLATLQLQLQGRMGGSLTSAHSFPAGEAAADNCPGIKSSCHHHLVLGGLEELIHCCESAALHQCLSAVLPGIQCSVVHCLLLAETPGACQGCALGSILLQSFEVMSWAEEPAPRSPTAGCPHMGRAEL